MAMRSSVILSAPRFERSRSVSSAESVNRNTSPSKRSHDRSSVGLGLNPKSSSSSSSSSSLHLNRKNPPVRMDVQLEEGQPAPAATPRQAATDDEGNTITLSLDIKSVKPYRTQDEYLYAMKEDLAEWFDALYDLPITVDDFFEQLETGIVLCQHANALQNFIAQQLLADDKGNSGGLRDRSNRYPVQLSSSAVVFRSRVQPGSFQSRDNISNFIAWCRQVLAIPDTLLFETEDLVSRKNERNVVLCVLEVARRGASYGMLAPKLVQFEAEIDAEIAQDEEEEQNDGAKRDCNQNQHAISQAAALRKQKPWIEVDMMSLDEMVRLILSACTCEHQFPMVRVSEGKYRFGESLSLIFLRILRNHVMVRIGGGWDTLECFLDRYDPCRCKSKEHRGMLAFATKPSTVPHPTEQQKPLVAATLSQGMSSCPSQHSATADANMSGTKTKDSPSIWKKGSPQKHTSKEMLQPEKSTRPRNQEQPPPLLKPKPQSPLHTPQRPESRTGPVSRRTPSPVPLSKAGDCQPPSKPQGGQWNRSNGPAKSSVTKKPDPRPSSASPSLARAGKTFRSSGDLLSSDRSLVARRSPDNGQRTLVRTGSSSTVLDIDRTSGAKSRNGVGRVMITSRPVTPSGSFPRSSSMDSTKLTSPLRQQKPRPATAISSTGQRPLSTAARTKSIPNVILSKSNVDKRKATSNRSPLSHSSGNLAQKLNGIRLGMTADKLLPSYSHKWTGDYRSSSLDVSPTDEARVLPGSEEDDEDRHPSRLRRSASLQPSVSFTLLHIDDYPESAPPEDEDLNARMEMLFEQYRDVELGLMFSVGDKTDNDVKRSVGGPASSKKNSAAPSSSKVTQSRYRSRERVGPETSPSRREGVVGGKSDKQQLALRTLEPSAKTPSQERVSQSSNRPASSSLLERSHRMVPRRESNSWSADQSRQTTRGAVSAYRPRSSFDASLRSTGDASPRFSSSQKSVVPKERALSGSREAFSVVGSLGRRNSAKGLSKSIGDISDIRLTLQRSLTANPATTSGIEDTCTQETMMRQVPPNNWMEGGAPADDNLQISPEPAVTLGDGSVKARPRKDDRLGPPTRIPLPLVPGDQRRHDHLAGSLKRFDSGVDITNISPTGDNGSFQGDEDGSCSGWTINVQCTEACSLSDQKLMFAAPPQAEDEFY